MGNIYNFVPKEKAVLISSASSYMTHQSGNRGADCKTCCLHCDWDRYGRTWHVLLNVCGCKIRRQVLASILSTGLEKLGVEDILIA